MKIIFVIICSNLPCEQNNLNRYVYDNCSEFKKIATKVIQ